MMRSFLLLFTGIALLLPLKAAAVQTGFTSGKGNMYSAGSSVHIAEDISGDLAAAGAEVTITGNAGSDVLAAGGSVRISGKTADDIRAAAGSLVISNHVGGEALLAGGSIELSRTAFIADDLLAAAGSVTIDGTVGGNAKVMARRVAINGAIHGDAEITADELVIGNRALINGSLRYQSPKEARIDQGSVIKGEQIFAQKESSQPAADFSRFSWAFWLLKLIAVEIAALAVYFGLKKRTEEIISLAVQGFGGELVRGFIIMIVIPVLILLLFISALGWILGLTGLFLYAAFFVVASVFGALIFSGMIGKYAFKKEAIFVTWPLVLSGVFLYQVIGLIPFAGWIFKLVFFLAAFGAVSHFFYAYLTDKPAPLV